MNQLSAVVIKSSEILFKETVTYDLLIALITGVLSCLIFFGILRIFRPNIKTCNVICKKEITDSSGNKSNQYSIKFYNMTFSDIENVSVDLFLMEDYFHGTAKNYKYKKLNLAQPEFKYLTGRINRNKERYDNCVQMVIVEDLEKIWNGSKEWLHLQIDSTHSKSGRRKVKVQLYKDPNNTIKNGKFDSGENFNIIKN
jgi:hypothetical protein